MKRTEQDFALLEKYRDLFGRGGRPADVIALQEIGTRAALERLFPPSDYDTIMSPRWANDDALEGEGDVYTAIAVRRDSGVEIVLEAPFLDLAVTHSDGHVTRAGTGALLRAANLEFWFLSVHLKSGCSSTRNIHVSTGGGACPTLWTQAEIFSHWVSSKRESGIPIVIAGDFNRRFRERQFEEPLWRVLNGVGPTDAVENAWFVAHPETVDRRCPTKLGDSLEPIDWILVDTGIADRFIAGSFWERRFTRADINAAQRGRGLSDHCPISIDLAWPG